jgi:hypothetical protein
MVRPQSIQDDYQDILDFRIPVTAGGYGCRRGAVKDQRDQNQFLQFSRPAHTWSPGLFCSSGPPIPVTGAERPLYSSSYFFSPCHY